MMQMLQAGGMTLLADGQRGADEHNPRGYFELEAVKHSRSDLGWLAQAGGRAVKVIHLLLPQLPAGRQDPCSVHAAGFGGSSQVAARDAQTARPHRRRAGG